MNNIVSRTTFRERLVVTVKTILGLALTRNPVSTATKMFRLWKRSGFKGLWHYIHRMGYAILGYNHWIKCFDTLSESDRIAIRHQISTFQHKPCISIIMPTYNSSERWLRRAIESVRTQLYPYWELCIADDASTIPNVRIILNEYQKLDERIKVVFRENNGHICAASNSALALASGEFVALLDHDDELPPHALYMVAHALNENQNLNLIYSDEDKVNENNFRHDPYFKSGWNPDLLTSQNFICHLGVYRTALVREIDGFRENYEGAQDWDLALRITERIPYNSIRHLPYILYHWRAAAGSTALDIGEKPYALQAAEKALRDHLTRTGRVGKISLATQVHFRTRYSLPSPAPLVTIVIPTRNQLTLLRRCIESLREKTRYPHYEILIVDNQSDNIDMLAYLDRIATDGIARVVRYNLPFNYSALNNFAVKAASGSYLCLMNNDIEIISEDWLNEMVAQAARPEIGAVGAKLYYPDNTIQHAGVILGIGGIAGHLYSRIGRNSNGYMSRLLLVQNLSAVTAACLVVRKELYNKVGGLDEKNLPIAFNDVDFCLRLAECGYQNL